MIFLKKQNKKTFKAIQRRIFMAFESFFNAIFGWAVKIGQLYGIIIISFIIALITTLVYKYFTDQTALKQLKEDNKKLQEEMKNAKGDVKKMADLQKQALQKGFLEPMRHQLKPLIITFIPFILIFGWLRTTYANTGPIFFGYFGWFGTYIIFSIIFTTILRKLLKVY